MNNLKEEREKSAKIVELNKTLLMFQMNFDPKESLNLSGDLDENLLTLTTIDAAETFDYKNRIEYSILKNQRELNDVQLGVIKGRYVPKLSAFATTGYNPAATNLGDIFQGSRYYNYTFIGLKLQVPIFHGFEKRYQMANKVLEGRSWIIILGPRKGLLICRSVRRRSRAEWNGIAENPEEKFKFGGGECESYPCRERAGHCNEFGSD
ncbi:MAG: hypothetical protein WDO15_19860 [Bacteroidota bacterium]